MTTMCSSVIEDLQLAIQKMQFHIENHRNFIVYWAKESTSNGFITNTALVEAVVRDLTSVLNTVNIFNSAAQIVQFSSVIPQIKSDKQASAPPCSTTEHSADTTEKAEQPEMTKEDQITLFEYNKIQMLPGDSGHCIVSTAVDDNEGLAYITISSEATTEICSGLKGNCLDNGQYQWTPPSNTIFGFEDVDDGNFFRAICLNNSRKFSAKSIDIFLVDFGEYTKIDTHGPFYMLSGLFSSLPGLARYVAIDKVNGVPYKECGLTIKDLISHGPWKYCVKDVMNKIFIDLTDDEEMSTCSNASIELNSLIDPPNGFASDDEGAVGYDDKFLPHKTSNLPNDPIPPPISMMTPSEKEINVKGDYSDILSEENEEDFEGTSNALKAVLGFIPKDDRDYCKFYDPETLGCFKGAHCTKIHKPLDEDGYTQDTRPAKISIPSAPLPAIGSEKSGYVTCVVSPEICYVHLDINATANLFLMNDKIDCAVQNKQLKPCKFKPQKFDLVTAHYQDHWYRAQVVDYPNQGRYRVRYMDYGNTCNISRDEIRMWYSEYDHVPFFAHRVRIGNVSKIQSKLVEATTYLQTNLMEGDVNDLKKIIIKILHNDPEIEVTMMDSSGFDIGETMVLLDLVNHRQV